MPGFLLNVDSLVLCAHGGLARPILPVLRVRVMNKPVIGAAAPYVIAGCPNPVPAPCALAMDWKPPSARVKAMGLAVLLADSRATCVPNGVPTTVIPLQGRVKGA